MAREDGFALLSAIMTVLLMSAVGTALILTSSSETMIAAHFRDSLEARYAAGVVLARGVDDLAAVDDWTLVTGGVLQSTWVDGAPAGERTLSDGSTIDLAQIRNLANCRKSVACAADDLAAVTDDRPWGVNNPRWTPYAYGPLRDILRPSPIDSPYYVVLFVGNGPAGALLALRAEAFGPRGAHAIVEATADKTDYNDDPGQVVTRILSWREVR
jgi:hypothetical protein